MNDSTAWGIAALVTLWLDAPLWVWVPFAVGAVVSALAEMSAGATSGR